MATIKSHTDLPQSKKLAEFLPLESADMHYQQIIDVDTKEIRNVLLEKDFVIVVNDDKPIVTPAWSLSALLNVLPKGEYKDTDLCCGGYKGDKYIPEWFCSYEQQEPIIIEICHADNPIDACCELILKLHEEKML